MGFLRRNKKELDDEEELSVPMRLIINMKRTLDILVILNFIISIALIISVVDSVVVRERNWEEHTSHIEQIVENYCGDVPWQN